MVIVLSWVMSSSHSLSSFPQDDVVKVLAECRAGNSNIVLGMLPSPRLSGLTTVPDYVLHSGNDSAFPLSDCDALLSIVKDFNCSCSSCCA
jgi:hypothetical protein